MHLAYLGDLDASGTDIERDWVARTDCWDHVTRIAVTFDQVADFRLPPAEGKPGDPRRPAELVAGYLSGTRGCAQSPGRELRATSPPFGSKQ